MFNAIYDGFIFFCLISISYVRCAFRPVHVVSESYCLYVWSWLSVIQKSYFISQRQQGCCEFTSTFGK